MQFSKFNYVLMYRIHLLSSGLYKLTPENLRTKCDKIRKSTGIQSQKFHWDGQKVKFVSEIKLEISKIVRKYAIEEGYNGNEWVVYVKRFGRKLFEIRQPYGEKKCPYELYDENWTYLPTGYTFTTKPIQCPNE